MIRFLGIRDLAIVERMEIAFDHGFNVLTGETGAGKSIIIGAIGLLAGGRAGPDMVRTGAAKAVVEAAFDAADGRDTVIRREIPAQGRSRVYIDDALSTAAALRARSRRLVDLHGQHEHQVLLDPRAHLALLDAYGGLGPAAAGVAARHAQWRAAERRRVRALTGAQTRAERIELLEFQLSEIDRVAPEPGEDDRLQAERRRLANADRRRALAGGAYAALYERDDAVLAALGGVWRQIDELAALDPAFAAHAGVRETVGPPLDDLAHTLRSYAAGVEASPGRLAAVEARLAEIERLAQRYGGSLDAVLARRAAVARDLQRHTDAAAGQTALDAAAGAARDAYAAEARALSAQRQAQARALAPALEAELRALAIPHGRVDIRLETAPDDEGGSAHGLDRVEVRLSANPGETARPLAAVASGGELSRVMLALKTLAATDADGATLVFDEVDAGIGGRAADRVGDRLRALGDRFQVLCVTHMAQLAAHATAHFAVSKQVHGGRTRTVVDRLDDAGRVAELARLMTGSATGTALASAGDLLAARQAAAGPG